MGIYSKHDSIYSSTPLSVTQDRDEYFLIDALGTWIPECEIIFYGLLGTEYANSLYKIRERTDLNPIHVYHELSFFTADDLIRHLSAEEDVGMDMDLTIEELSKISQEALDHYDYSQCSETMMRHAIMEIMYDNFVKSVTLVYPWEIRPIDMFYLRKITPQAIFDKLNIATGTLPEVAALDSGIEYTTIISNSIEDIDLMVSSPMKYHCRSAMFLLRNHSGNMVVDRDEDGSISFIESKMDDLLPKLIDFDTGIPLTGMRFGRFEPELFTEAEKRIPRFIQH